MNDENYTYHGVYDHFRKWTKDGSWAKIWSYLLDKYRNFLDMSHIDLDAIHTIAKKGGEQVAYQGHKKAKTSNLLF